MQTIHGNVKTIKKTNEVKAIKKLNLIIITKNYEQHACHPFTIIITLLDII